MPLLELLVALVKAVVWIGGYSQLVGMPVAWLRLRRSPAWTDRPARVRWIDLLADFITRPTVIAIAYAWVVIAVVALTGLDLSAAQYLALIWGPPTVFVPIAVLRLDTGRFPDLVEEKARHAAA
jgi:hypothetical protein